MPMIWTPAVLPFFISVAIVSAFLVVSEKLTDRKRARRAVRITTERQSPALAMRRLPLALHPSWRNSRLTAEATRRIAPD